MNKITSWMLSLVLVAMPSLAMAGAAYLGVDNQGVSNAPDTVLQVTSTDTHKVENVPGSALLFQSTSTLNVNVENQLSVSGSTMQVMGLNGGAVVVAGVVDVSASSVGIRGSQGNIIASSSTSSGASALEVINVGRPNLDGMVSVRKSSDAMNTASILVLTGLCKSIDLQAIGGDCNFTINGGDNFLVNKNTSESYDLDYMQADASVTLVSKGTNATCKVRMFGAN